VTKPTSCPDIYIRNVSPHFTIEVDFPAPVADTKAICKTLVKVCRQNGVNPIGIFPETDTNISIILEKRPPASLITKLGDALS
jgi:hypothetical protein